VEGNVTHCFVGNLTDFPAVKEFENRLRSESSDATIVTRGWSVFLGHCVQSTHRKDFQGLLLVCIHRDHI